MRGGEWSWEVKVEVGVVEALTADFVWSSADLPYVKRGRRGVTLGKFCFFCCNASSLYATLTV